MIRVENLRKEFGEFVAVENLSFEVAEGEILGFLGPNGAGKTTTMRILTGYFPPTSGVAEVGGFDIMKQPFEARRVIGYMPEGVPLYREMTVQGALEFVADAKSVPKAQRRGQIDSALAETNLGDVRRRLIGQLSKGFRQRVALAQAIIGDPKVLILDEPTVGLDPRQIADMRDLIKGMAGRRTVILSTHILPEVQITCNRVVIINKGRIAATGTPEKLTTQMRTGSLTECVVVGPPAEGLSALERLPGVMSVRRKSVRSSQAEPDGQRMQVVEYIIESRTLSGEMNPAVANLVVECEWKLLELRTLGFSLEEIFLKAISGETIDAPAADRIAGGRA